MLKLYGNHPSVTKAEERLKKGRATIPTIDITARYLQEIGQYRLIDAFDELTLFTSLGQAIELIESLESLEGISPDNERILIDGAIAQRTIYLSNLRIVVYIAKRFRDVQTMPLLDLVQEGNIGLSKAIARFDIQLGYKFSTYATQWIRQQITRAIGDQGRLIRMPIHNHERYLKVIKERAKLWDRLQRSPTTEELSSATRIKPKDVELLLLFGQFDLPSLNAPMGDTDNEYGDILADKVVAPLDTTIDRLSDRSTVNAILTDPRLILNDQEKIVVSLRFGIYVEAFEGAVLESPHNGQLTYHEIMNRLSSSDGLTLEEASTIFGVTRERIRQVQKTAMEKIQAMRYNRDFGVIDYE